MIDLRLLRQLEKVATRVRHGRLLLSWTAIWLGAAALAALWLAGHALLGWHWSYLPHGLAVIAGGLALVATWRAVRGPRNYRVIARRIEVSYPELNARLLTAVDQPRAPVAQRLGFLQDQLIQQALAHAYRHGWLRAAPLRRLALGHAFHLLAFLVFVAALTLTAGLERPEDRQDAPSNELEIFAVNGEFEVEVEPGDTEVERGTSLWVVARFRGPLPPEANLHFRLASGEGGQIAMTKSLKDPLFGGRIPDITQPASYHVTFAEHQTDMFTIGVFEYPRLARADARLAFPSYTGRDEQLIQDVRTISAVEGTVVTLLCYLNKPVAKAEFIDSEKATLALEAHTDDPRLYTTQIVMERSQRWELHLRDESGRGNKQPPKFIFNVLPNLPPDLKLLQPSRDLAVSPLEEMQLEAQAWDDFGLSRLGLSFSIGGEPPEEVVLASAVEGKQRTDAAHLIAFEDLEAEPDQLMTYYLWAEDKGPDGETRRVEGDMYFAEVRHFEEIFRQGEPPPAGQGQPQQGAAGEADELAQLQKEIINATWRVMRRERAGELSSEFSSDLDVLVDSQASAMELAEALNQQVQDARSKQHLLTVRQKMLEALQHLSEAKTNSEVAALQPALAAEQAAYQELLKLRAREHEVVRQQSTPGQSSSRGANRSQQQLQQLELQQNENRYETESAAQQQQDVQDRETRQVLNRLRELARRQNDLNERLKELQSALQEASNEQEREEIRRQLERLREEQEQILRDLDELRDRMDQPQNQEQMAEPQQQLQEARENVRQSSEALQEGRVGQAITSGTRAEREFEEVRDEFRRRSANRFEEEMREMRQQAQELDDQEQQLGQTLESLTQRNDPSPSLREPEHPEALAEALQQQRERLQALLERMRDTVSEAESSEPLLAEQLYDAARQAMQQELERALEASSRSLERGFPDEAQRLENIARQGITQLRQGVEKAAEHVLGDETEALRRAREELERLSEELNREIADAQPGSQLPEPRTQPGEGADDSQNQQTNDGNQESPGPPDQEPRNGEPEEGQPEESPADQAQASDRPGDSPSSADGQGQESGRSQQQPDRSNRRERPRSLRDEPQPTEPRPTEPGDGQQPSGRAGDQPQRDPGRLSDIGDREGVEFQPGDVTNVQRRPMAPLTGEDYVNWSDRLRDVEEMIDDPELRAEAARIRDRARGFRQEVKRHSQPPNWDLVRVQVAQPLVELYDRVSEELLKRASREALVPIDRDPVPPQFGEAVRRYYERLGSGN